MAPMNPVAKTLIFVGIALIVTGLLWQLSARLGLSFGKLHLGKLPGDIAIEKPGMRFYFPITTSILISVILSLILYLVRTLSKK